MKGVSVMISESSATQFSMMIIDSIGTVCIDKTERQLGKQFR
jgi:hypothetical protein